MNGLTFGGGLASHRRQDGASAVAKRGEMWITKRGTRANMVILVVFFTEFTTYFYFGVRRLTKFFDIESKSLYNPVILIGIFQHVAEALCCSPGKMLIYCNIEKIKI